MLLAINNRCSYCRAMRPLKEGGASILATGAVKGTTSDVEDRAMVTAGEVNDFAFTAMTIRDTTGVRGTNQGRFASEALGSGTQMKLVVIAALVGVAAGLIVRNRA